MHTLSLWIFPSLLPGSPQGFNPLGDHPTPTAWLLTVRDATMAITWQKRVSSQEPRPKSGIRVKMKVTVDRKIHEAEAEAGIRTSHQEKLEYSPVIKEAHFTPFLNITPTHSPMDPWLSLGSEEKR